MRGRFLFSILFLGLLLTLSDRAIATATAIKIVRPRDGSIAVVNRPTTIDVCVFGGGFDDANQEIVLVVRIHREGFTQVTQFPSATMQNGNHVAFEWTPTANEVGLISLEATLVTRSPAFERSDDSIFMTVE